MTKRESDLVQFLRGWPHAHSPSFEEMRAGIGLASKTGVFRLVASLEAQGVVERRSGKARSVRLAAPGTLPPSLARFETAALVEEMMRRGYSVSRKGGF